MAAKRALCIGINHFHNYPGSALQGCVNDAKDMASVCKDVFHFSDQEIMVLTDEKATKANIMKQLNAMVEDAIAGKIGQMVFSMSSHGTQVPDVSGDEPDRADEAFCTHDLAEANGQWDRQHIIVDDELHDLFVKLPHNVLLEVFMDTCHSGTGLKALDLLPGRKPRFLPPPSPIALAQVENKRYHGLDRYLLEKGITHHILWAACRANQTSADAHIAGGYHGAFTYYFCKEIREHPTSSRKDLLTKVRADLKEGHYSQTPQLEVNATNRRARLTP